MITFTPEQQESIDKVQMLLALRRVDQQEREHEQALVCNPHRDVDHVCIN